MADLKSLTEHMKLVKEKIRNEGLDALKESLSKFFDNHKEAKAIVWTQYTPHFNDGDACTFSVNEMELRVHHEHINDDVKKLIKEYSEGDGEDDYQSGYNCAAELISRIDKNSESYYTKDLLNKGVELRELTKTEKSLIDDFESLRKELMDIPDVLEMIIGDHAYVYATRDKIEITEFDHD